MKQLTTILLLSATGIVFSSCHKHSIKGDGSVTSETRNVSSFHTVCANGDVEVRIHQSTDERVVVTGYSNLIPVYKTKVKDGKLTLEFEDGYWNVRNNNIRVDVYTNELSGVDLNGSGDIYVGAGIDGESLHAEINGSGEIEIASNTYDDLSLKVNGSGEIRARDAEADNADARISGSGKITLTVHNYLNAKISGSGTIDYSGNPERVDTEVSGSGKIRKQ